MEWYCFGRFETGEVTPALVADVLNEAQELRAACRQVPVLYLVELLAAAGRLFAQEGHPLREEALAKLPGIIHFSREMTAAGLDTLAENLSRRALIRRLSADLGDLHYLDEFRFLRPFEGQVKAEPRGLVAHIAAGNVFVSAVDSLAQGIVTKNVNLLKMSGADPLFPMLFARALREVDPDGVVARTFALLPFRGGNVEVEKLLKERCNAIVVYGGADAVAAYRDGCGLHTRLIEYGPKYSCALLDAREIERIGLEEACELVARDLTMWDQSACTSPHTIFINDRAAARRFAAALGPHMRGWAERYPHGEIPVQERVEITRTRELARVAQALGEGELFIPDRKCQDWTIVYEEAPTFRVSCHHRTGYVKPVTGIEEVAEILKPYGEFLQSVGILADPGTTYAWADRLIASGADRITELGDMTRRKHGAPHDGGRGTAELVRWVGLGRAEPFQDAFDYQDDEVRDRTTLSRLNLLLTICRESAPFYRDRLPAGDLRSLADLQRIPVLSQEEFRAHLPPTGTGIVAGRLGSSISYGSGGTTGTPKCVFRTNEETARNARGLGKGYYLSAFGPGDVVANLMFAGNLWASFLSMNQALEYTGCHILPIGGHIPLEAIIAHMLALGANCAVSVPSVILSVARHVEERGLPLRIEKLATGGEHLFPSARDYLTRVLGTTRFVSTGYAANDTGAIGFQCEACQGGVHHVHENLHVVEILDPHTEDPAEEGKIVVTNIDRHLMPTLRYDLGDMGRWLREPCPCGRKVRRFELLGRSDDVVIIGGFNVQPDFVATAIGEVPGLSLFFRIIARFVDLKDELTCEVEALQPVSAENKEQLAERLREGIYRAKPEFKTWLATGSIAAPVVRVLDPHTLPRNPRTGKIRQVVDERHA